MKAEEIRAMILEVIHEIVPDEDVSNLKGDVRIRDQIEMDSMDFLDVIMELRKRYRMDEGDPLTLIDLGEGFFLSPGQSVLPKLVAEIETLRQKNNITLEELIKGVAKERSQ